MIFRDALRKRQQYLKYIHFGRISKSEKKLFQNNRYFIDLSNVSDKTDHLQLIDDLQLLVRLTGSRYVY